MRSIGYNSVYELKGGILQWRNDGLSEKTHLPILSFGMSKQQFDSLLISDKFVLVDFYAPWCVPCKKMKPNLDELGEQMKDKLILLRIDADENQSLFSQLKLKTLPTILLYKNKNLIWSHSGYVDKQKIYYTAEVKIDNCLFHAYCCLKRNVSSNFSKELSNTFN